MNKKPESLDTVRERERERDNLKKKEEEKPGCQKRQLMLTWRIAGQSGERESNLEKLSFICCAQNKVEIKNRYESIIKTDYFEILKLILMNQLILHDSLFY